MKTRIKVCGLMTLGDAQMAIDAGAFAVGFVFADSPRRVSLETAKKIVSAIVPLTQSKVHTVGVFVDESLANILAAVDTVGLSAVQLHGGESPALLRSLRDARPGLFIIKAIGLDPEGFAPAPQDFAACDCFLFDSTAPRTESPPRPLVAWRGLLNAEYGKPFFVAGGLRADNISALVSTLRPFGLDVSSGVEAAPGKKDAAKLEEFFKVAGESYV